MNEYVQVLILGVIQGIAEFLPISSSGHLVLTGILLEHFTGMRLSTGKELEVLLHLGTLGAILLFYFDDLWRILFQPRIIAVLIVATIPAAIIGLTLEDWFDRAFDSPMVVGFGLLMTAFLLLVGQKFETSRYDNENFPWIVAVVIGCFQAAALLPGISRSGSTISGGLLTGVNRITATRYSFLLAIPITAGAILITCKRILEDGSSLSSPGPVLVGIAVSFIVGLLTLRWLVRLISQRKLHWFAGYCAVVGLATLIITAANPPDPSAHSVSKPTPALGMSSR